MDREISRRGIFIIYPVIGLFTIAPILNAMIAGTVARLYGAKLDEGDVHPCIIHGVDIGGLLYDMLLAVWFTPITLLIGLLAMWLLTLRLRKERNRDEALFFATGDAGFSPCVCCCSVARRA